MHAQPLIHGWLGQRMMLYLNVQAVNKHEVQSPQHAPINLAASESEKFSKRHGLGAQARSKSNSPTETASQAKLILGTNLQPSSSEPPQRRSQKYLPQKIRFENSLVSLCKSLQAKLSPLVMLKILLHLRGLVGCKCTHKEHSSQSLLQFLRTAKRELQPNMTSLVHHHSESETLHPGANQAAMSNQPVMKVFLRNSIQCGCAWIMPAFSCIDLCSEVCCLASVQSPV